jgi:hypothetical protein
MDTTALDELIAQVRGTVTALAEAEEKVATVRTYCPIKTTRPGSKPVRGC